MVTAASPTSMFVSAEMKLHRSADCNCTLNVPDRQGPAGRPRHVDLLPAGRRSVYTRDTLVLLKHVLASGLSKTAIADQLGISRRLVHHLIATGQLDRDLGDGATPRVRTTTGVAKLAAVTPLIEERLTMYPALSAVRLFAECRAAGYSDQRGRTRASVRCGASCPRRPRARQARRCLHRDGPTLRPLAHTICDCSHKNKARQRLSTGTAELYLLPSWARTGTLLIQNVAEGWSGMTV